MATKIGGFTKSGVVQCVKLVEESSDPFLGTYENGVITFNSGLTFKFEYTSNGSNWYPLTNITSINGISIYSSIGMSISISGNTATLNGISNPGVNSYRIASIEISISTTTSYICRCIVSYDSTTSEYRGGGTSTTSIIFSPYLGNSFTITPEMQVMNTTVKFGKDGTLRCKELIEEPILVDKEGWNATLSGATLTFNNGFKVEFRQGNSYDTATLKTTDAPYIRNIHTYMSVTDYMYLTLARDGDTNNFIANFKNPDDFPSVPAVQNSYNTWISSQNINLTIQDIFLDPKDSSGTSYDRTWYITTPSTYAVLLNPKNQIVSAYEYTGGYMDDVAGSISYTSDIITQKDRMKIPTVRVYKDGTIKCAEVEEATVTAGSDGFEGTMQDTQVLCQNGYKFYFRDKTTQEKINIKTIPLVKLQFILGPASTGSTAGGILFEISNGVITNTSFNMITPNDFLNENWVVRFQNAACTTSTTYTQFSEYDLVLEDSNDNIIAVYDYSLTSGTATTFSISSSSIEAPELPYIYRNTFTWPGSTPSQPSTQNNFLTSDAGPLITSDGQEFLVQDGGGGNS